MVWGVLKFIISTFFFLIWGAQCFFYSFSSSNPSCPSLSKSTIYKVFQKGTKQHTAILNLVASSLYREFFWNTLHIIILLHLHTCTWPITTSAVLSNTDWIHTTLYCTMYIPSLKYFSIILQVFKPSQLFWLPTIQRTWDLDREYWLQCMELEWKCSLPQAFLHCKCYSNK
jgi:hypothetical protein